MDDRYPVSIGYPDASTPSGMKATPRLRAHLSQRRFAQWKDLLDTLSEGDRVHMRDRREALQQTLPPTDAIPGLLYVVISQRVDRDPDGYVSHVGGLSIASMRGMIEFMHRYNALEDELDAEAASDWVM